MTTRLVPSHEAIFNGEDIGKLKVELPFPCQNPAKKSTETMFACVLSRRPRNDTRIDIIFSNVVIYLLSVLPLRAASMQLAFRQTCASDFVSSLFQFLWLSGRLVVKRVHPPHPHSPVSGGLHFVTARRLSHIAASSCASAFHNETRQQRNATYFEQLPISPQLGRWCHDEDAHGKSRFQSACCVRVIKPGPTTECFRCIFVGFAQGCAHLKRPVHTYM